MKKLLFIFLVSSLHASADIRLPAILGDHMVLQQNTETRFWGWAGPGEWVRVQTGWSEKWDSVKTSSGGRWEIVVNTPAAGGPYEVKLKGANEITIKDVLIGEVWVCSGQSNMEWSGSQQLPQSLEEAPNATNPKIRFFYIPKTTSETPQDDVHAKWVVCSPEEMKKFSAIGYFFGKKVNQETGFPMGMINANWGGTPAETWTPSELVNNDPELKAAASKLTRMDWWPIEPGFAYNAMIYPITRYAIGGVLWYQGESNTGTSASYKPLFTSMIGSWRKAWGKEFPFYYVQIAPFDYGNDNINGALLREQQTNSQDYPKVGMVVISDLVDNVKDIHPRMKKEVAFRLADLALSDLYGKNKGQVRSPSYKNMQIEKGRIRISFNNADNGLVSRNGDPNSFMIAGADRKFVPAQAKIEGNQVIVWSKEVKEPVAVRFGFTNTAMPNLFSKTGLPADLFRTDNWDVK